MNTRKKRTAWKNVIRKHGEKVFHFPERYLTMKKSDYPLNYLKRLKKRLQKRYYERFKNGQL